MVEDEIEAVSKGKSCAEVVAAHGIVVSGAASEWYGGEHEIVEKADLLALAFGIKASSETGGLRDDCLVACRLPPVGAVVVDIFDVLLESDVEFPTMG